MKKNYDQFKNFFLKFIQNKKNRFHPLVWINGHPSIGKNVYIGGFSEINSKGAKVSIGNNCDISSFVAINVADSHLKTIGLRKTIIKKDIKVIIHAAAQPSHDWAKNKPFIDFDINAKGTLNLLELTRLYSPNAPFIFMSTNKVYGDILWESMKQCQLIIAHIVSLVHQNLMLI